MVHVRTIDATAAGAIASFGSVGASSLLVADGAGPSHIYLVTFEAGGSIGPHVAGFDQLFLPIAGAGWIAGQDGHRLPIDQRSAGVVRRGDVHSKGSDEGMTALMVQAHQLAFDDRDDE